MPDIQLNIKSGEDVGAVIQKCIDDLPERDESWSSDGTQTIVLSSTDCKGGEKAPFDVSQKTKVVRPPKKHVQIRGTGIYGIRINNDIPGNDATQFEMIGTGVGDQAFIEKMTLRGGGVKFLGNMRGFSGVRDLKVELSPQPAVQFLQGAELGPTNFECINLFSVGCAGSVNVESETYLISRIIGGRTVASQADGMRFSGRGVDLIDHDFTAAQGESCDAYVCMHGDSDSNQDTTIERCRFGSEEVAGNVTAEVTQTRRPSYDIVMGDGVNSDSGSSHTHIYNNSFAGGSSVDGTSALSAIKLSDNPRQVYVDNGNQFDGDYTNDLVEESWLGDGSIDPLSASAGQKNPRNYWGINRVVGTPRIFSNGGVGWEMPKIDMNSTTYSGPSVTRMMSNNGNHFLFYLDDAGNPVYQPASYL